MQIHEVLVDSAEAIIKLVEKLRTEKLIAIDTEFIRESTFYPQLEIIQVATASESWLIDLQSFRLPSSKREVPRYRLEELEPFIQILRDSSIIKVMHAAQADQECLYTSLKAVASPSFDTAVAASLLGEGDSIGLGNLIQRILGIKLGKGHARTDWSVRPLSRQQMEYAHADVIHLVKLYEELVKRLKERGRVEWAMELSAKSEDESLYDVSPEELTIRLIRGGRMDSKEMPILYELMKWRESYVRSVNLPRRWVADDGTLIDLVKARPKTPEQLLTFRGLNKGEARTGAQRILGAIKKGETEPDFKWKAEPRAPAPNVDEARAMDLLKCFISTLADEHAISVRHLVAADQLLIFLRGQFETIEDLTRQAGISRWAASIIGEEVLAFLHGKHALSLKRGRISVTNVA